MSAAWPFGDLRMFGYDLAVVDPPWPWEAYGENGYAKSPEAQYRTMPLREIAVLPVGQLLGAGGAVFLWCTWPLVAQGVLARQHSRKPDEAYAFLEALTPKARRADLFARQRRPGWDAWGDELDKFEGAAA